MSHIDRERLNVINVQETHWSSNEFKDNISKAAKFFHPCSIYGSHCKKDDKAAGVITIVKGTLQRNVLSFEELYQGRLTCLKLETNEGIVNVVNWYGVHKVTSEFHNILTKLTQLVTECMFHSEHIVILGDLNINLHFGKNKKKANLLREWLEITSMIDLTPSPIRPSFKLSRGSSKPYSTRPDHIISSISHPNRIWDVDMFLQHKMVCVEYSLLKESPCVR